MLPWSAEQALMELQYQERKGIFACEHSAVYSNVSIRVGELPVRLVHTDLSCPLGGQWNTRLNTPIFRKLWNQVLDDGQHLVAAWSVKVDPDAVFLAHRLQAILSTGAHDVAEDGNGMFLNNCRCTATMHGPLEVISRRALQVYAARSETECQGPVLYQPDGQRPEQEDVYMRLCLLALGSKQINEFSLLSEQFCDMDWSCKDNHVSFHPFKTATAYRDCLTNAEMRAQMH